MQSYFRRKSFESKLQAIHIWQVIANALTTKKRPKTGNTGLVLAKHGVNYLSDE